MKKSLLWLCLALAFGPLLMLLAALFTSELGLNVQVPFPGLPPHFTTTNLMECFSLCTVGFVVGIVLLVRHSHTQTRAEEQHYLKQRATGMSGK